VKWGRESSRGKFFQRKEKKSGVDLKVFRKEEKNGKDNLSLLGRKIGRLFADWKEKKRGEEIWQR